MRNKFLLQIYFTFLITSLNAQTGEIPYLGDKPGTFEILNRTDYAMPADGFSKTDLTANLERIKNLVAAVRQNPVLADIKGFNGRARIYTISHLVKCGYGVPSRISFEFCSFYYTREKKIEFNTIEPPEWSVMINQPVPGWSDSFDSQKCYFTAALHKETIAPGIDVYDKENFVIYDPSRPDYWIPVTVNEAFAAAREFNAKEKDPVAASYLKEFLDNEWNDIPAEYRDKPAYFGGGISRVTYQPGYGGQDSLFPRLVKVNPAYWNKLLPKAAIQIITLKSVQNKVYLKQIFDDCMKYPDRGSGCDLLRFEYSYGIEDIKKLAALIGE